MTFVDSHAHLEDEQFDTDREEVISRLESDGISLVINIGSDLETSRASMRLAEKYRNIYFAAGIHPHEARACTNEIIAAIEKILHHEKCVAVGEIGLDYFKNYSPHDIQRQIFEKQLIIAKKKDKPFCIHMRDATKDTVDMLKKYAPYSSFGVIHSYSASKETAKIMLDMGLYISISGPVTYNNAVKLKEVVSYLPADRLLIETDCPYLTPVPNRGKRNEPKYVRYTAAEVAKIKNMKLEDIARITSQNTRQLFKIN